MRIFYVAVLLATLAVSVGAPAMEALPITSVDGGVVIVVTPIELSPRAETWTFKIVLDTHSADLSDDLTVQTVLVDDAGRSAMPLRWEGAGAGGHHREGLLHFRATAAEPGWIELRITRIGEASPRIFRWQL